MSIKDLFNTKKKTDTLTPQDKERRMRLRLNELSRVSKLFQAHPHISIKSVIGTPPEKYFVVYRVDGLQQNGTSIEARNEHTMELSLSPHYPVEPPTARMITSLFHPNVSRDQIDLTGIWTSETSLADCIVRIGELIIFKRYSTDNPLNCEAAQWALRNKTLLPLSEIDLCYCEIDDKSPHVNDNAAQIPDPAVSAASDAEQTRPIDDTEQTDVNDSNADAARISPADDAEQTRSLSAEEETAQLDMETSSTSDTVAIIPDDTGEAPAEAIGKKENFAPAPEVTEQKAGGAVAPQNSEKKGGETAVPKAAEKKTDGAEAPGSTEKKGSETAAPKAAEKISGAAAAPGGTGKIDGAAAAPKAAEKQTGGPAAPDGPRKVGGAASAQGPEKPQSPIVEKERRKDPMATQNKDDVKNSETGRERILNKPLSAQIAFDDAKAAPFVSQEKFIPETSQQSRQLQVIVGPFCHRCGFRVNEYANFCGRCGAKLNMKSSNLATRILLILGMIAIPVIIFEMGSVIFLLNKKVAAPATVSSPASVAPESATTPAMVPEPTGKANKTVRSQEPPATPISEKSPAGKTPSAVEPPKQTEVTQESSAPSPRPAVLVTKKDPVQAQAQPQAPKPMPAVLQTSKPAPAVETPKSAPPAIEAPKASPVAAEAPKAARANAEAPRPVASASVESPKPKAAPVVAEAPKSPPVAVEAPRPAPVAVEPPKPAPAVEAPKPSAPAGEPVDPAMARAARKKAAVDGFLSTSDGAAAQPGNANAAPANQAAVTDNLKLAKLYMGIGSYDDAISRFREVIKLDPFNQDAIQGLVQAKKMKASASGK